MTSCAPSPSRIAQAAAEALREELETFPKPGLVSFEDNGSHPGMDAECFLASIAAITPFFAQMAEAAAAGATLRDLQEIGLAAERAMFAATGGRNTHKGGIYCLGLLSAATALSEPGCPLGATICRVWGGMIPQAESLPETSAGIALCRQHRIGGVRREAAAGFPSVYQRGLPALGVSADPNAARVQAFFALLETCEDTTLLKRGGWAGMEFARAEAVRFLAEGGVTQPRWRDFALKIHRAFVSRHLTAGGAADLLAATLFVAKIDSIS